MLERWRALIRPLREGACTKPAARRAHCAACGWLFPRLGHTATSPAGPLRDKADRSRTTTNFLSTDIQQAVRQLQVSHHPAVAGTPDVRCLTCVALRRGANSAAAVADVATKIRQVQGRWVGEETADQNYMFIHRNEFVPLGQILMQSNTGARAQRAQAPAATAAPSRPCPGPTDLGPRATPVNLWPPPIATPTDLARGGGTTAYAQPPPGAGGRHCHAQGPATAGAHAGHALPPRRPGAMRPSSRATSPRAPHQGDTAGTPQQT